MATITGVQLRAVLDSRGNPTIEAEVRTRTACGRAIAPSGASTGTYEAVALPKGGAKAAMTAFRRRGVPRLVGQDVRDQTGVDAILRRVDGTAGFSRIGASVAVSVSLATAKAAAQELGVPLCTHAARLAGLPPPDGSEFPAPMGNMIGGGAHAVGGTDIQEFMCRAEGLPSVTVFANGRVHRAVRQVLQRRLRGKALGKGDEGAWVAPIADRAALAIVARVCREQAPSSGCSLRPAIDVAASELFRKGTYRYRSGSKSPGRQIRFVESLAESFGLTSVEDPLAEDDFAGFAELTDRLRGRCRIVGDDLLVTNPERLERAIESEAGDTVLVKPNQVGTVSDTIRVVRRAQAAGWETIVSHRSGESEDPAIAHLAVGWRSWGLKCGAVGGERTAKLNEMLRLEESLRGARRA